MCLEKSILIKFEGVSMYSLFFVTYYFFFVKTQVGETV